MFGSSAGGSGDGPQHDRDHDIGDPDHSGTPDPRRYRIEAGLWGGHTRWYSCAAYWQYL